MLNIKQRQMNLTFLNYYKKEIDGIEGSGTKQAYKEFQKDNALVVDGIYGAKTNEKMIEVIKSIQKEIGATVDGIAGTETIQKCREYQSANGLEIDGIAGVNTRAKIFNENWEDIRYFKKEEFTCKCGCGHNNINLKLVKIADNIRAHFGQPAIVSSGTRCSKHNAKVGGVSNSRHLSGKAVDFCIEGISSSDLVKYTKSLVDAKMLRYTYAIDNKYVHIDIV